MSDPYQVLGISRSASSDEIKKAYRNLSRKYHPDANINNPNKAQAEERFKEIQQAYKQIMDEKENGYYNGGWSGFGTGGYYTGQGMGGQNSSSQDVNSMHLKAAANYINSSYYREALNVLAQMQEKNGHMWHFQNLLACHKGSAYSGTTSRLIQAGIQAVQTAGSVAQVLLPALHTQWQVYYYQGLH